MSSSSTPAAVGGPPLSLLQQLRARESATLGGIGSCVGPRPLRLRRSAAAAGAAASASSSFAASSATSFTAAPSPASVCAAGLRALRSHAHHILLGHTGCVNAVALSGAAADGDRWIASAGDDKRVLLWEAYAPLKAVYPLNWTRRQQHEPASLDAAMAAASSPVRVSPYSASSAAASTPPCAGMIHRGFSRSFQGHQANVFGLAFTPDARRILSCGLDAQILLYDIETNGSNGSSSSSGRPVDLHGDSSVEPTSYMRRFAGHHSSVHRVSFVAGGSGDVFLSASNDRTCRLFDMRCATNHAQCVGGFTYSLNSVHASPTDANVFATAGESLCLHDWRKMSATKYNESAARRAEAAEGGGSASGGSAASARMSSHARSIARRAIRLMHGEGGEEGSGPDEGDAGEGGLEVDDEDEEDSFTSMLQYMMSGRSIGAPPMAATMKFDLTTLIPTRPRRPAPAASSVPPRRSPRTRAAAASTTTATDAARGRGASRGSNRGARGSRAGSSAASAGSRASAAAARAASSGRADTRDRVASSRGARSRSRSRGRSRGSSTRRGGRGAAASGRGGDDEEDAMDEDETPRRSSRRLRSSAAAAAAEDAEDAANQSDGGEVDGDENDNDDAAAAMAAALGIEEVSDDAGEDEDDAENAARFLSPSERRRARMEAATPPREASSCEFSSDGRSILACMMKSTPLLFSIDSPVPILALQSVGAFKGYSNTCTLKSACFAGEDDRFCVAGSDNFGLYIWDRHAVAQDIIPSAAEVYDASSSARTRRNDEHGHKTTFVNACKVIRGHRSIPNNMRFSASHMQIFSCGVEKVVRVFHCARSAEDASSCSANDALRSGASKSHGQGAEAAEAERAEASIRVGDVLTSSEAQHILEAHHLASEHPAAAAAAASVSASASASAASSPANAAVGAAGSKRKLSSTEVAASAGSDEKKSRGSGEADAAESTGAAASTAAASSSSVHDAEMSAASPPPTATSIAVAALPEPAAGAASAPRRTTRSGGRVPDPPRGTRRSPRGDRRSAGDGAAGASAASSSPPLDPFFRLVREYMRFRLPYSRSQCAFILSNGMGLGLAAGAGLSGLFEREEQEDMTEGERNRPAEMDEIAEDKQCIAQFDWYVSKAAAGEDPSDDDDFPGESDSEEDDSDDEDEQEEEDQDDETDDGSNQEQQAQ